MKETEHHYFTPLGQCQRAPAGKWKKKKDGRPKNVLRAHFFPLLQMYRFHPFLLLINSVLQTPAFIRRPLPPPRPREPAWISGGGGVVEAFEGGGGVVRGLQTSPSSSSFLLHSVSSPSSQSCSISRTEWGQPRVYRLTQAFFFYFIPKIPKEWVWVF